MIPVRHRECGGQIGWHLNDFPPLPGATAKAAAFRRMDGSQPLNGVPLKETCLSCQKEVHAFHELTVCADEFELEGKALFQNWNDVDAFVKELVEKAITAFGPHPEYPAEK